MYRLPFKILQYSFSHNTRWTFGCLTNYTKLFQVAMIPRPMKTILLQYIRQISIIYHTKRFHICSTSWVGAQRSFLLSWQLEISSILCVFMCVRSFIQSSPGFTWVLNWTLFGSEIFLRLSNVDSNFITKNIRLLPF